MIWPQPPEYPQFEAKVFSLLAVCFLSVTFCERVSLRPSAYLCVPLRFNSHFNAEISRDTQRAAEKGKRLERDSLFRPELKLAMFMDFCFGFKTAGDRHHVFEYALAHRVDSFGAVDNSAGRKIQIV